MAWTRKQLSHVDRMNSGDIQDLDFRVLSGGAVVSLAAYSEIAVKVFALGTDGAPTGAAVISDNLAGDVDLVGGGTTGLFKDALAAADTASLSGLYWVQVQLTDGSGNVRTCRPVILPIRADLITS